MKLEEITEKKWSVDEVVAWCKEHHDDSYGGGPAHAREVTVLDDGSIQFSNGLKLKLNGKTIPFKIDSVAQDFSLENAHSLKNCPKKVMGYASFTDIMDKSFEGLPEFVGQRIYLVGYESLHDIHKHLKKMGNPGSIMVDPRLKKCALGVLLIDGVKEVDIDFSGSMTHKMRKLLSIIEDYLGQGKQGMIKAQRKMIEADLDDFAEL